MFDVADDEAVLRHLGAVADVVLEKREALRPAVMSRQRGGPIGFGAELQLFQHISTTYREGK